MNFKNQIFDFQIHTLEDKDCNQNRSPIGKFKLSDEVHLSNSNSCVTKSNSEECLALNPSLTSPLHTTLARKKER